MKKFFYIGALGLSAFEILNVFFIMPMPGSQEMNSLGFAYFLYSSRWYFRIAFSVMVALGFRPVFTARHAWLPAVVLLVTLGIVYLFNFRMVADHMFLQPNVVAFDTRATTPLEDSTVVIGIARHGDARAYPVRYILFHHQVRDTVGGMPVMVTYCSVCRTGRVYQPIVNGQYEKFRLVGMDHYNAMFEDHTTQSWWRQVTGVAVAGPLKGQALPELPSRQCSLGEWFTLYPDGKVMRADKASMEDYDTLGVFERGHSLGKLTLTDTASWNPKSWVIGIAVQGQSRAYDWHDLVRLHAINDTLAGTPVVIVLAHDGESFAAFVRPDATDPFAIRNDTLYAASGVYDLQGSNLTDPAHPLTAINAYQEFWHSWKTFHSDARWQGH